MSADERLEEMGARALYEARGKPCGEWRDGRRKGIREWVLLEWHELDAAQREHLIRDASAVLEAADLEALRERAEKAERENDEKAGAYMDTVSRAIDLLRRAEAAEVRIAQLEAALDAAAADLGKVVNQFASLMPDGRNWRIFEQKEATARAALSHQPEHPPSQT